MAKFLGDLGSGLYPSAACACARVVTLPIPIPNPLPPRTVERSALPLCLQHCRVRASQRSTTESISEAQERLRLKDQEVLDQVGVGHA